MLDKKFFIDVGPEVRDKYRKHIFKDAKDVKGRKFKSNYSSGYAKRKKAGGKGFIGGFPFNAPVASGDTLKDYSLIKTMSNLDTLTFFIHNDSVNHLGILINNHQKNTQTIYNLNLLDIPEETINIPPVEFETELSLPSSDFQKIIRDMINIGENIEIKSIGSQLLLNCSGDFASQETVFRFNYRKGDIFSMLLIMILKQPLI